MIHRKNNFVKLAGDYLGEEIPMCCYMATWTRHIDRFNKQYNKAFSKYPLFGADFIDIIHKLVQVFLDYFNISEIENIELFALTEFVSLQNNI